VGRKKHEPTEKLRAQVKALASFSVPKDSIARYLGMSQRTLQLNYAAELHDGGVEANAKVANALYKQALDGNVTAGIFWLKARAGWTDRGTVEADIAREKAEEKGAAVKIYLPDNKRLVVDGGGNDTEG